MQAKNKFFLIILCLFSIFNEIKSVIINNPNPNKAILQSDGKLVIAGDGQVPNVSHVFVARYNTDGSLDNTFGTNGIVLTQTGSESSGKSLIQQSDGKIIVAGYARESGVSKVLLIRYNTDGSLDTSFGSSGKVTTPVGSAAIARGVVLQSGNEIVVSGMTLISGIPNFFAARYINNGVNDGTLDTTYGTGGIVSTLVGSSSQANSMIIQSDNKVVLGGQAEVSGITQFALVRYTTSGALDATFGTGGVVTTIIGNRSLINSLKLDASNRIVSGGVSDGDFALARYTSTGALDSTFNTTGIVTTNIGNFAQINSLVFDTSGGIIAGGFSSNGLSTLAKYTTSGSLDTGFNGIGILIFNDFISKARAVVVQSDNKIIMISFRQNSLYITRLLSSGATDSTYGTDGVVEEPSSESNSTFLWDQKATGTDGGTFISGAWQTRTLNQISGDTVNVTLLSNQFTLDTGKYLVLATAPAFAVGKHQIRLQNITDGVTEKVGSSAYAGNTVINLVSLSATQTDSYLNHILIITQPKTFEIQHQCEQTESTDGFGLASNITSEIYTQVQIIKLN